MSEQDSYQIVARIVAKDVVDPATNSAQRKLEGVERKAERVGISITRVLGCAFAALGGGFALRQMVGGIIDLNSSIEEATYGMASLFTATTGSAIADSVKLARDQVKGLREDAAIGVGELEHYLQGFQMLLAPVLQAGGSTDTVRGLTRNALAAGFALRGEEGLRLAPMDIQQALTQGLGDRTTPIALAAVRAIGMDSSEFNALDTASKIEKLNEAFQAFAPGVELMGKTWSAQMSTFRDGVSEIVRTATRPLFERWSEGLQDVNGWIEDSQARLANIADGIAPKLVGAWDLLAGHTKEIAAGLIGLTAAAGAGGIMAAGGFAGIAAGLGAAAAAAGPFLLIAGAVGVGALSMLSAWEQYPETLDSVKDKAGGVNESFQRLLGTFDNIENGSEGATFGSLLSTWVLEPFLSLVDHLIKGVSVGLLFAGNMLTFISEAAELTWRAITTGNFSGLGRAIDERMAKGDLAIKTGIRDIFGPSAGSGSKEDSARSLADFFGISTDESKAGKPGTGATANMVVKVDKIEIKTERMDDPDRVAGAFEKFLHKVNRHRRTPLLDPFPSPVGT